MPKKWLHVIDEAVKKIENDEIELGIQALQKVQEYGKELPEVMLYLADVWYQLGHFETATNLLTDILQNEHIGQDMEEKCKLLLAEIALDEGDYDSAQTILYDLKEEGCKDVHLYLLLADLYAVQELDDVAVKYLEIAMQKEPDNEDIKAALGNMYDRMGRFAEAMEQYEELSQIPAHALLMKGRLHAQHGEFEKAYEYFKEAVSAEETVEALYGCGLMAFHLGLLEEAHTYIMKILAQDDEYTVAYQLLADVYLSSGKSDLAIDALKTYVDLSGFDLSYIQRLIALLLQAGRYDEAKEYQKLMDQWDEDEQGV